MPAFTPGCRFISLVVSAGFVRRCRRRSRGGRRESRCSTLPRSWRLHPLRGRGERPRRTRRRATWRTDGRMLESGSRTPEEGESDWHREKGQDKHCRDDKQGVSQKSRVWARRNGAKAEGGEGARCTRV